MFPKAFCIHQAVGRLRIRIPSEKGNHSYFALLEEQLSGCPLVTAVKAIPLTGSILISHSNEIPMIADFAKKNRLFQLVPNRENPESMTETTITAYKTLDTQIQKISGGELDLPNTAFLTLVGVGVFQIARGKIEAPAWHVAFWYALNIFLKTRKSSKTGAV